jgi:hypothetical protein
MPDTTPAIPRLSLRDPAHLEAHRAEYLLPLETLLELAARALAAGPRQPGAELKIGVRCPRAVGSGGLARLWPWTRGDFWAPRPGRTIPSHLIAARRRPTRWLCIWGSWESDSHFVVHTLYPGRPAPREIHDPDLAPAQLNEAIRFWSRHAIIVESR